MRLPRMTTRRWMVAVAVVGSLLGGFIGGYRLKRRHDYFVSRVQFHAKRESVFRSLEDEARAYLAERSAVADKFEKNRNGQLAGGPFSMTAGGHENMMRHRITYLSQGAAYHGALARKYRRAASFPWFSVEPDPPEPRE